MKKLELPKIKVKVAIEPSTSKFYIKSPDDCFRACQTIFDADTMAWTEEFVIICLSRSNEVLGTFKVASGGFAEVTVDTKVILTVLLNTASSAVILAHNHPSGNMRPSDADIKITKRIYEACKIFDIQLLDHLILSPHGEFYSMKDNNLF